MPNIQFVMFPVISWLLHLSSICFEHLLSLFSNICYLPELPKLNPIYSRWRHETYESVYFLEHCPSRQYGKIIHTYPMISEHMHGLHMCVQPEHTHAHMPGSTPVWCLTVWSANNSVYHTSSHLHRIRSTLLHTTPLLLSSSVFADYQLVCLV